MDVNFATFQNIREEHKQRQQEIIDGVDNIKASQEFALENAISPAVSAKEIALNVNSATKIVYTDHSPITGAKLTLEDYNKGQ